MSPTLLEGVIALVLMGLGIAIGLAISPRVLRFFRRLERDVDKAADEADKEKKDG